MLKKRIFNWVVVFLILGVIYYFSDQESVVSSGTSNGISKFVFDLFKLDYWFEFDCFHILIRKLAHFGIYALLGFFVFNALFYSLNRMEFISILLLCILGVFIYAVFDEMHQLFVFGRSGEFRDVIIDTSGGSVGGVVYYFLVKIGCVKYDLS